MKYIGLFCGVICGLFFALSTLFAWELNVYEGVSYGVVLAARGIVGCLCIFIYNIKDVKRLAGPPGARLALLTASTLSAIANLLFIISICTLTSFSLGTALSSTQSLWCVFISYLLLKDTITSAVWIGSIFIFASYLVIALFYDSYTDETWEGIICGVISSLFYGGDVVALRYASFYKTSDDIASFYMLIGCVVLGILYSFFDYNLPFSLTVWLEILGTSITSAIGMGLLVATIRIENAPIATLLSSSLILFSVVLQYALVNIYLEVNEIIEMILIVLGILVVNTSRVMEIRKENQQELLRQEEASQTELSQVEI